MKNDTTVKIRLPKALLNNAKKVAEKEGLSLSEAIRIFLSEYSTGIIEQ